MFTGIIGGLGEILSVEGKGEIRRMRIACPDDPATIARGASIACNGVCLTVLQAGALHGRNFFDVDVGAETLAKTTLGVWTQGRKINLERSLKIGDELGGHFVTGHVDSVAHVLDRKDFDGMAHFDIRAPKDLMRFIAAKGSISLDGASLTVNAVLDDCFSVLLIPHTLHVTTFNECVAGDALNLEVDLMARYAARWQ